MELPAVNYDPVIAAIKAVKLQPGFMPNRPSNDWKILFDFYNNHSGFSPLQMGCQPCYKKVYEFTMTFLISKNIIDELQSKERGRDNS